jgi:hypothetical protein
MTAKIAITPILTTMTQRPANVLKDKTFLQYSRTKMVEVSFNFSVWSCRLDAYLQEFGSQLSLNKTRMKAAI